MFYNLFWRAFYALRRFYRQSRFAKLMERAVLWLYGLRRWYSTTDAGKRSRIRAALRSIEAKPHHWDAAAYARAWQGIEDIKREPRRPFPRF